ncbi:MAG: DUF853 family protein [Solirubrobacterales bacterium]|nr:DUF853 family protein [Solirubrobacterales bacterium]
MSRLRSPRLMLLLFVGLLAAPSWATAVSLGLGALILAARALRPVVSRWRQPASDPEAVQLGLDQRGRRVSLITRELSAHGLILGASGSGKTTTLLTILEQQVRRGVPVVAIDMKGSPTFAAQLAGAARAAGRPFQLWSPDGPGFWNPLQHGNATEGKDKLIATERFTEPHYQRAAERYVQTLLQVLSHVHPGRAPTLDEVVSLMDPRRLPPLLRQVPQGLAERVQDYCAGLTSDQVSAVRGLQTRLAVISEAEAGVYLRPGDRPPIDLRRALDGPEVVLFSLNSSRYGKFAAQLGTLVVQDLICATGLRLEAQRSGAEPNLALVAIDEFSGIGGEHVVALFARGREAGVGALVATQEMADLDRAGRGVRDQVLGSTALKLILRQDVPESAETVARLAGTERVWEETRPIGGGSLFTGPLGRGTRREVERFIVDPNAVKSLRTGEAVLVSKLSGRRPEVIRVSSPAPPALALESPGLAPRAEAVVRRSVMHLGPYRGPKRTRSSAGRPAERPPSVPARRLEDRRTDLGR